MTFGATTARKLDIITQTPGGALYSTWVEARRRPDGMWEAWLSFRPSGGGIPISTAVQTTQTDETSVLNWAAGLTVSHVENAFTNAVAPVTAHDGGVSAAPTPAYPSPRLAQLRPIERDVLGVFTARGVTRIPTQEIFDRGPHANADFVRAFEDLEKQWRYLVRRTVGGTDWLELTMEGARALGIPSSPGGDVPVELPRGVR